MNIELIPNRYNRLTPNATNTQGVTISCPYYISLTSDQKKALLNGFRKVKTQQLLELGYQKTVSPNPDSWVTVETNTSPPMTPCEELLGMTEDSLRYLLFGRQGIQERLYHKLANVTGLHFVTKEEIIESFRLWVETNYEQPETKTTNKRGKRKSKTDTVESIT